MLMIKDFSNRFQLISGMPINSKGGKDMLKRAGIDTNSKQYQAVMKSMSAACSGVGYTNVQAIKNRISCSSSTRQKFKAAFHNIFSI